MHAFLADLRQQLTDVSHSSHDLSDSLTCETAKFSQPPQQLNSFFNFSSLEQPSRGKIKTKSPMQNNSGSKSRKNWTWDDLKENNQSSYSWNDGFEKLSERKDNVLQELSENNALCSPKQVAPAFEVCKEFRFNSRDRDPSPFALIDFDDSAKKSRDSLDEILDLAVEKRESEELYELEAYKNEIFNFTTFAEPPRRNQHIDEVTQVSKRNVNFGTHFPGKIFEEDFEITNLTNHGIALELSVSCLNLELQNSQEYIYSVRSANSYDFSERRFLTLDPQSKVSLKVALKVPGLGLKNPIQGQIKIVAENFRGEHLIDLSSNVVIPKVFCTKQLFSQTLKRNLINMAVSKSKSQNLKLPFRNDSETPVTLELGFYKPAIGQSQNDHCEVTVSPKVLTIPPKSNAIAVVSIKPKGEKFTSEIKVLYGKVPDSSLAYSFVMKIETY